MLTRVFGSAARAQRNIASFARVAAIAKPLSPFLSGNNLTYSHNITTIVKV